jgi:hypothetical protein
MAQEALTGVMVAGVGCGRKKKRLQRREKGWKEKRERAAMAAWWSVGRCVGFMWCSWWRPWSVAGTTERERGREQIAETRGGEVGFWPILDSIFSSLRP